MGGSEGPRIATNVQGAVWGYNVYNLISVLNNCSTC